MVSKHTELQKKQDKSPEKGFDLEMLYVECSKCGRPLIWEKGTTTFLIQHSGIDQPLGSDWIMLSRGCPVCSPGQQEFTLTLARSGTSPDHPARGQHKFN